ncbi:ATP-binding protein [Aliifodinibius salicampi]|uniref:histidine kinase n=1 Tax=Fodinibius salicampi TaxID=1920655 RepID=A0ABT3PVR6_9BACT|nr:two-component regulator propeller domain-containing protein [Fodinibius salicampi]MCW9711954.1 ATP-binding protein [Fodinibius salicampi]
MVIYVPALGQSQDAKPELNFNHIQQELLSNTVTDIYQDKFGYMWIGTYSGLHRYDGIQFHEYIHKKDDSTSLGDNIVQDVYEDQNNVFWVRTRSSISRYNRTKNNFTTFYVPANPNIYINNTAIEEDENGRLWVLGGAEGLYYFDPDQQKFIPKGSFKGMDLSSLKVGESSILWLTTSNNGLIKFNTEEATIEQTFLHDPTDPQSLGSNYLNIVQFDSKGNLWVGTNNAGADRMVVENGDTSFVHYRHVPGDPHSLGNNDIFYMKQDRRDQFWITNENGGLHLYNPEADEFYRYEHDPRDVNSLSSNSIYCFFEDSAGRYWVGTGINGLNIADPYASKFKHYTTSAGKENWLSNGIIRDFYETEDGNIWIATDGGGLNYFNRTEQTFEVYRHDPYDPNSLPSDAVIEVDQDPSGRIWVGTWGGGLNILVDRQEKRFVSFQEMIGNHQYPIQNVFDVHFDSQNDYIWIASNAEGLYRYNTETEELQLFEANSEQANAISSNAILNIFEDSRGNLWFATENGLNYLSADAKNEGLFKRYIQQENDSTSIPDDLIRQVYEDSSNNIWIATKSGLSKYIEDEDHFMTYDQSDGLPSNEIRSIVESDNQELWIGTIKGLSNFDPKKKTFENYDRNDGLQANEFSRYAALKLSTGELLFGGINGFNLFDPDNIYMNPNIPPVYLSDFKLYNESVNVNDPDSPLDRHISMTDSLTLSYRDNVFSFEFVALNYTKPDQNEYAYMMESFEEKWNYVDNQRNATYTNLDPGDYTFRVKAANNDGVWNEEGVALALTITPPFWQTTWFYVLSALFIIGIVYAGYQKRVRGIKAYSKRLEKEVKERTSELNKKNEDLKSALKQLEEAKDELVENAHKAGMADLASGILHNVGNILNSVNTSASLIKDTMKRSNIEGVIQANSILREHIDDIEEFIAHNPKGIKLMRYYLKLEEPLKKDRKKVLNQIERLTDKIKLINDVIAAQQSYAGASMNAYKTSLSEMIDDALALQAGSIERHGLNVKKEMQEVDSIVIQRSKLIHVLVNIFKNAKEAMEDNPPEKKDILIKSWQDEDWVYLSITDNGSGIKQENLNRIFTQEFTTKQEGHGFGLHSSANYIAEMGGKITVDSKGEGKGAAFTLMFPREQKGKKRI